jgi:hypothetical protein
VRFVFRIAAFLIGKLAPEIDRDPLGRILRKPPVINGDWRMALTGASLPSRIDFARSPASKSEAFHRMRCLHVLLASMGAGDGCAFSPAMSRLISSSSAMSTGRGLLWPMPGVDGTSGNSCALSLQAQQGERAFGHTRRDLRGTCGHCCSKMSSASAAVTDPLLPRRACHRTGGGCDGCARRLACGIEIVSDWIAAVLWDHESRWLAKIDQDASY